MLAFEVWIWILGSTLAVSIISFVGAISLGLQRAFLHRILFVLISLSVGALFGDVFFHLLPEVVVTYGGFSGQLSVLVLSGIVLFFVLEKFLVWHHHHTVETPDQHVEGKHAHVSRLGLMNVVGDGVHNFLDGMIIAASFLISPSVGVATTMAVLLHEIPQEIGDFGVLIHAGYSVRKALFYNFLSALMAFVGALVVLTFGVLNEVFLEYLVPVVAGGFLYIAGSDLIPELHKQVQWREGVFQLLALVLGMALMWGLLFLETS